MDEIVGLKHTSKALLKRLSEASPQNRPIIGALQARKAFRDPHFRSIFSFKVIQLGQ